MLRICELVALEGGSQLDGYIARTFDMKSIAGSYLDPIADKVLVMSVYLTLGSLSLIPGQPYPPHKPPGRMPS